MNDDHQHLDNGPGNDAHPDGYGQVLRQIRAPTTIDVELRDRQISTAVSAALSGRSPAQAGEFAEATSRDQVIPLATRRGRRATKPTRVLAGAAALVIAGAIGIGVMERSNTSSNDTATAASDTPTSTSDQAAGADDSAGASAERPELPRAGFVVADLGSFTDVTDLRSAAAARSRSQQIEAAPAVRDDKALASTDASSGNAVTSRCADLPPGGARFSATLNGLSVLVIVEEQGTPTVLDAATCASVDRPLPR